MRIPDPLVGGVGYGPFQGDQRPGGAYPTDAQLLADLTVLKGITETIRTYGVQENLRAIPALAEQIGLDVAPAAYLTASDRSQRDVLIEVLNEGNDNIPFAIVGSEWGYEGMTAADIIAEIGLIRAAVPASVALTTAERAQVLSNLDAGTRAGLADAVDFLLVNISVFEPGLSVAQAVDSVVNQFRTLEAKYPGEKLVIGELGWPSAGGDPGETNPAVQARFFAEFAHRATAEGIPFFAFEAFDEPWKADSTDVPFGPHWGLYGSDRLPKGEFASFLPWAEASAGADSVEGGAGKDLIHGLAGDDSLAGQGDDDILWGGDGDDRIDGGPGDDRIDAGLGDDSAAGGPGDDSVAGSPGDDRIDGDDGDDVLDGGDGDDNLAGGDGNDTVIGGSNDDVVSGGLGADVLFGDDSTSIDGPGAGPVDGSPGGPVDGSPDGPDDRPAEGPSQGPGSAPGVGDLHAIVMISEEAGFSNIFGWYDPATGEAHALIGNTEAAAQTPLFSAAFIAPEGGNFGFFLVPDGYTLNSGYGQPLAGLDPTRVSLRIAEADGAHYLVVGESDQPLLGRLSTWDSTPIAYFSDPSLNPGGRDVTADGDNGLTGWEDWFPYGDEDFDDLVVALLAPVRSGAGADASGGSAGGGSSDGAGSPGGAAAGGSPAGGGAAGAVAVVGGDDTLIGAGGNDTLIGGGGGDTFVIQPAAGGSAEIFTILDYNQAEGDVIDLSAGVDEVASATLVNGTWQLLLDQTGVIVRLPGLVDTTGGGILDDLTII
jgi:exo-beta-1,3-glucanase (GH17 family)